MKKWLSIIGILGLVLWLIKPEFSAYLIAYLWILELALGATAVLMLFELTGGEWGVALFPLLEAARKTVPYMVLFFIPILIQAKHGYPWVTDPTLPNHSYLNLPFFIIRSALYFGIWILISKLKNPKAGFLVIYVFTASFAAIDWQMSIEPHWPSTVYGMVFVSSQGLGAYAFALLILNLFQRKKYSAKILRDLGNLLLAFVMTWAYLSFVQYLIIWSGNLPEEVTWFIKRTNHGWGWIASVLIVFQFALPFSALLFRSLKYNRKSMLWICAIVLFAQVLERIWYVAPAYSPNSFHFSFSNLGALVGLTALWVLLFFFNLKGKDYAF